MLRKFCEHTNGQLLWFRHVRERVTYFFWKNILYNLPRNIFVVVCKFVPCLERTVVTDSDGRRKKRLDAKRGWGQMHCLLTQLQISHVLLCAV